MSLAKVREESHPRPLVEITVSGPQVEMRDEHSRLVFEMRILVTGLQFAPHLAVISFFRAHAMLLRRTGVAPAVTYALQLIKLE